MKFARILSLSITFTLLLAIGATTASAQDLSALTKQLKTPDGEIATVAELGEGKVTIISFVATWCVPCKKEMTAIKEMYGEMQEKGIEYIAIFIDNTKTMSRVGPYVKGKDFSFPVLLDPNEDIFDLVNGSEVPYMLIYDANGELKFKHDGFFEGDESHIMEEATSLLEVPAEGDNG